LIAFLTFEFLYVLCGGVRRKAAIGLNDLVQRLIDIFRHPTRVAADVEMRASFQSFPQLGTVLGHPVLHVNFEILITRKGGIQAREHAPLALH
jgi:hypothetical protein